MTLAALAVVWQYGSNVPFWDEWWDLVPHLTGALPVTPEWLWSQNNEHRLPLPRLLTYLLFKISGGDFRAVMYFSVLSLSVLAAAMIEVARRLRGSLSFTDAVFPLLLLHLGHFENFLWGFQVAHVLTGLLVGTLLLIIVRSGGKLSLATAVLFAIGLVLLPCCGGSALVYALPLALWLGSLGLRQVIFAEPASRRSGYVMIALALVAPLIVGCYFLGYTPVHYVYGPKQVSLELFFQTACQFLTNGFGTGVESFWPWSGLVVLPLWFATPILVLYMAWQHSFPERFRSLGILFLLSAVGMLAVVVGWKRPNEGFTDYYSIYAGVGICALYFAWDLYGPRESRWLIQLALLVFTLLAVPLNTRAGLDYAKSNRESKEQFEQAVLSGLPTYRLIKRYGPVLCPSTLSYADSFHDFMTSGFEELHDAGIGVFKSLRGNPSLSEIRLSVKPRFHNHITWVKGAGHITGNDAYLVYVLPKEQHVCGVRIKYAHFSPQGIPPVLQLRWRNKTDAQYPDGNCYADIQRYRKNTHPDPGRSLDQISPEELDERTFTCWVDNTVSEFRLYPDLEPCAFRIEEFVLLVAPPGH